MLTCVRRHSICSIVLHDKNWKNLLELGLLQICPCCQQLVIVDYGEDSSSTVLPSYAMEMVRVLPFPSSHHTFDDSDAVKAKVSCGHGSVLLWQSCDTL